MKRFLKHAAVITVISVALPVLASCTTPGEPTDTKEGAAREVKPQPDAAIKPEPGRVPENSLKAWPEPVPKPELVPQGIIGKWEITRLDGSAMGGMLWEITATGVTVTAGEIVTDMTYEIIPGEDPARILVRITDGPVRPVIFKCGGDTLTFKAANVEDKDYAKDFSVENGYSLFELKRVKIK